MSAPVMCMRSTCASPPQSSPRCALLGRREGHGQLPSLHDGLQGGSKSVGRAKQAGSADQSGQEQSAARNLKRQSQAEPFQRSAVFLQLIDAIVKWDVVPCGELHELLNR